MSISNMENKNSEKYLHDKLSKLLTNIKNVTSSTEITPSNYTLGEVFFSIGMTF